MLLFDDSSFQDVVKLRIGKHDAESRGGSVAEGTQTSRMKREYADRLAEGSHIIFPSIQQYSPQDFFR